jgi:hypothetical protein
MLYRAAMAPLPFEGNHWLPGFNFNVEEWDAKGLHYERWRSAARSPSAAPCSSAAVDEKPGGRFTIRQRIRVVKRHPEGDR